MKKIFLLSLLLTTITLTLLAQNTVSQDSRGEGVIAYEEKINLHRRITDEAAKAFVPEFRASTLYLYFRGDECLYKVNDEEEDEETQNSGGMQMMIRRPKVEIYRNMATGKSVSLRDFMDKKFLIEADIQQPAWKLGTETKKIAGYECTQATLNDTVRKQEITAWFTMDIPLAAGPQTLGGLPGLILQADVNKGESILTATKIEFKKVKDGDLKAPSKGEKITDEAFRKKVEEFRRQNGGTMRIIRN
jgi:GLPGLI family protein